MKKHISTFVSSIVVALSVLFTPYASAITLSGTEVQITLPTQDIDGNSIDQATLAVVEAECAGVAVIRSTGLNASQAVGGVVSWVLDPSAFPAAGTYNCRARVQSVLPEGIKWSAWSTLVQLVVEESPPPAPPVVAII
jgi:hypothetical protein